MWNPVSTSEEYQNIFYRAVNIPSYTNITGKNIYSLLHTHATHLHSHPKTPQSGCMPVLLHILDGSLSHYSLLSTHSLGHLQVHNVEVTSRVTEWYTCTSLLSLLILQTTKQTTWQQCSSTNLIFDSLGRIGSVARILSLWCMFNNCLARLENKYEIPNKDHLYQIPGVSEDLSETNNDFQIDGLSWIFDNTPSSFRPSLYWSIAAFTFIMQW